MLIRSSKVVTLLVTFVISFVTVYFVSEAYFQPRYVYNNEYVVLERSPLPTGERPIEVHYYGVKIKVPCIDSFVGGELFFDAYTSSKSRVQNFPIWIDGQEIKNTTIDKKGIKEVVIKPINGVQYAVISGNSTLTSLTGALLVSVLVTTITAYLRYTISPIAVIPFFSILLFVLGVVRGSYFKNWFYGEDKYLIYVLREDLEILLLSLSLFICLNIFKERIIKIFVALFLSIIVGLYASDILTQELLANRLYFSDILVYAKQKVTLDVFIPAVLTNQSVFLILLSLLSLFFTLCYSVQRAEALLSRKVGGVLLLISTVALGLSIYSHPVDPLRQAYLNVFVLNSEGGRSESYSNSFRNTNMNTYEGIFTPNIVRGKNTQLNVIQIIFESYSVSQTALFNNGRLEDLFPLTDRLIRDNAFIYKNFYQNTYNSASGQFVTISGHYALPNAKREYPWDNATLLNDALPKRLAPKGYSSAYIASVELDSSGLRKMAELAGFDTIIEGKEVWGGVAHDDKDLYNYVMRWIDKREKPYYVAVVNSTTHPPYLVPPKNIWDYRESFLYADEALAAFIKKLQETGYFDSGILLVSSDHKSWEPVTQRELSVLGPLAMARVPLFVLGKDIPHQEVYEEFETIDIAPSLEYLLTDSAMFYSWQKNIFETDQKSGRCIVHHNGNSRDYVYVSCHEQLERIEFNGDRTGYANKNLSSGFEQTLNIINAYRIFKE